MGKSDQGINRSEIDDSEYKGIGPMMKSWFEERDFVCSKKSNDDFYFTKKNKRITMAIYAPNEHREFRKNVYPVRPYWVIMSAKLKWHGCCKTWVPKKKIFNLELSHPKFFAKLEKFIK